MTNRSSFITIILASLLTLVVLPSGIVVHYLFSRAQPQFVSTLAFTIRSEELTPAADLLGGLSALGSGSSSDTDVLFEYVQSKSIVVSVNEIINLRDIYSKNYLKDPWFAYDPSGTIEDLVEYWPSKVKVFYDKATGLIEIQVRAFKGEDAKLVADTIYMLSTKLVNRLSAVAREDAISFAKVELELAAKRLRDARSAFAVFRSNNQMVDPRVEIEMHVGVINALQSQLSELYIDYDLIFLASKNTDPRLDEITQKIKVVERRIQKERSKFASLNEGSSMNYSALISEFEGLIFDREYAERQYIAAQTSYDIALAEAKRQSKYLAAYVEPTIAERAEYPKQWILSSIVFLFLFFSWFTLILIYSAIRDRR